jgi:prepilin-type N-terminal cleavage/methylation domain-containing protein
MIRRRKSAGRRESEQSGFTLIETIITLVVLSIAIVGVLSVFAVGMKGSSDPLILHQATQLAQGEMEQVFGEKTASGFTGVAAGCQTPLPPGFVCTRTITLIDPDTKQVTVTITQPIIGSVSLDTLITHY